MDNDKKAMIRSKDKNTYMKEVQGLERDYILEICNSKKRAWKVATASMVLAFAGLAAGYAGFNKKQPDPQILRVDAKTGAVDPLTPVDGESVTYEQIQDEYWLLKYVNNRESYDYNTIQATHDITILLSSEEEQKNYQSLFEGDNAIDKILQDKAVIRPEIVSIQTNGQGQATVRFVISQKQKNGAFVPDKHMIATISYEYIKPPVDLESRWKNYIGFQVTSYHAVPEVMTR